VHTLMRQIDRAFGLVASAAPQLHLLRLAQRLAKCLGISLRCAPNSPYTSPETALHSLGRGPPVRTPPWLVACEATFLRAGPMVSAGSELASVLLQRAGT